MSNKNSIVDIATQIRLAYENQQASSPVSELFGLTDIESAYMAQNYIDKYWQSHGRRLVGRKIALTNKAVQQQFGVDSPCHGNVYADMVYADGTEITARSVSEQRIETEIALVLKHDLNQERHTVFDIIKAVDFALPAFEIVDSRIINWNITPFDFVVDNTSSRFVVLGSKPTKLSDFDIVGCSAKTKQNDHVVNQGSGANCLGNPLHALAWLADELVKSNKPLKAGEFIITGALAPVVKVNPGDRFEAEIDGLGKVRISFSAL